MKYLTLILLTLAVVCADHQDGQQPHDDFIKMKAYIQKYGEHCAEQLGIPEDLVAKYNRSEYPDDEKTHCYVKCVFEKFRFFDKHTGFDEKQIHLQLFGALGHEDHDDDIDKKIAECADIQNQSFSACERTYRFVLCIKDIVVLILESVEPKMIPPKIYF